MHTRTLILYISAAVVVVVLGALLGWYFYLRGQSQAATAADRARGFTTAAPFGSPSGSTHQNIVSSVSGDSLAPSTSAGKVLPQLWHADSVPVAGFAFAGGASSTQLSYVEQGNGYIFKANVAAQSTLRLTNTLLPKIYEALITSDGGVVERSVDVSGTITTFAGRPATSSQSTLGTTTVNLVGSYLLPNMRFLAVNAKTNEIFSVEGIPPSVSGVRMQWGGDKRKSVLSSAVGNWRPLWLADGRIILLAFPADGIPGYAYTLGSDGALTPLIRALPGLTILPRVDSSALLYGVSSGGGLSLYVRVDGKASPTLLSIHTVADKCVWAPGKDLVAYCAVPQASPSGNFLNDWYKGVGHTADSWWRIDASAGSAQLMYTPDPSLVLDAEKPVMDGSGDYIAFRNARDGSLWVLRVKK